MLFRSVSEASHTYKVSSPLLFVANFITDSSPGNVTIYDAKLNNPSPIAVISDGIFEPGGDCIDGEGTLYVSNNPGSSLGWVAEYPIGQTEASAKITEGIDGPAFCAIDSQGNLWIANAFGPNVTEYLKGSTKPYATITNGLTHPDGIAFDHDGNLYVGNLQPYGTSNVQVYFPGSTHPRRTITQGLHWPVGIAIDPKGALYVANAVAPCNIEEYQAGQSKPYRKITDELNGPGAMAFSKSGRMYETNGGTDGYSGPSPVILEFRVRKMKPSKRMIAIGLQSPVGIAYYPPLLP